MLETLAAAYAANGNFDKAIEIVEKALALAKANGQENLVIELQERLELYRHEM